MFYYNSTQKIEAGDNIIVDGMNGVVVCDFDGKKALAGFSGWIDIELLDGSKLSQGIMVQTEVAGLIHYEKSNQNIVFVSNGKNQDRRTND